MASGFDLSKLPTARELTDEESAKLVHEAEVLERAARSALSTLRASSWAMAEALYEFDEAAAWTWLGYDSLGAWLADPEIDLSRTSYFRFVGVYRELVVRRGLAVPSMGAIDIAKADIVLPAVKDGRASLDQALEDAESMTQRELRAAYPSVVPSAVLPSMGRPAEPTGAVVHYLPGPAPDLDVEVDSDVEPDPDERAAEIERTAERMVQAVKRGRAGLAAHDTEAIRAAVIELAGLTPSQFALTTALSDLIRSTEQEGRP